MTSGRSYLSIGDQVLTELTDGVERIDQLEADALELGVKELRSLIALANQQPFGQKRLLTIRNADALSEAAQNTLLKLLEEPPAFLTVALVTRRPGAFLPTVRSRLHVLSATHGNSQPEPESAELFQSLGLARSALESCKDRPGLVELLTGQLTSAKSELINAPSSALVELIDLLDRSIRRLNQNANQKLVVDAILLNWPFNSSTSDK